MKHNLPKTAIGYRALTGTLMAMGLFVCLPQSAWAAQPKPELQEQTNGVRGRVVDENGEPLIGVTVRAGQGKATVTDLDGRVSSLCS